MKRIIRTLSIIICFLTAFLCFQIDIFAEDSTNTTITLSTREQNGQTTIYDGYVYVIIKGSKTMEGDATVYYSTQDVTACAALGDYESVSGSVVLNKKNNIVTIPVKVNTTDFGVSLESKTNDNTYDPHALTRSFDFVVTQLVYKYGDIDNRSIRIDIDFQNRLDGDYNPDKGLYVFSDYVDSSKNIESNECGQINVDKTDEFTTSFGNKKIENWMRKYVNTRLANIYGGVELKDMYRPGISFSTTKLRFGNYTYPQYYENFSVSISNLDGDNFTYDRQKNQPSGYSFSSNSEMLDYGNFYGMNLTNAQKSDDYISTECLNLYLYCDNTSPLWHFLYTPKFQIMLYDRIAPTVKSVRGITNNVTYTDDKIKVAVRFSEPVQIKNNASLYAKIYMGGNDYAFEYVEGSGTDTFIFAIDKSIVYNDATRPLSYDKVELVDFYSDKALTKTTKEIYDFSLSNNELSFSNSISGETEFDFSNPNFSISTSRAGDIVSSRSFSVEVKNINSGSLYYLFSDEKTLGITLADDNSNLSQYLEQFQSFVPVENSSNVLTFSATDKDGKLLNGEKYLHLYLLSSNGKGKYMIDGRSYSDDPRVEPYRFDSTKPVINKLKITDDSVKNKVFSISYDDPGYSSGIKSITIEGLKNTSPLTINGLWNKGDDPITSFTINISDIDIEDGEYGFYTITVTVTDVANNSVTKTISNLYFDTREIFELNESVKDGSSDYGAFITTNKKEKVYKITDDLSINYSVVDSSLSGYDLCVKYLKYGDTVVVEDGYIIETELFSKLVNSTDQSILTPGIYGKSGRMDVIFGLYGKADIESSLFSYYFTTDFNDEVINQDKISNSESIKNYLYTLNTKAYYYLDGTEPIGVRQVENYTADGSSPVFSDANKAYQFVRFYELQDMKVIYLDNSDSSAKIISWIKNRQYSTGYFAAENESKTPEPYQYWVRYKDYSWEAGSGSEKWAYYYLDDTSGIINPDKLPAPLAATLKKIVDDITKSGQYKYYTGSANVNSYGCPNIEDAQIIKSDLIATASKCNAKYIYNLVVERDSKVFDSYYQENVKYLMHYRVDVATDPGTRLFYYDEKEKAYVEISILDGNELDLIFPDESNAIYKILELGQNGASIYKIYVDRKSPDVMIRLYNVVQQENGKYVFVPQEEAIKLGASDNNRAFTNAKIAFEGFDDSDPWAYIHIENLGTKAKYDYLLSEFKKNSITLADGHYSVYISDRYGNKYQITLDICSKEPDVEVTEVENSYLFVEISNREESEIFSYQVYLNDTILSTKFAKKESYVQSGEYRIVIKDIYGYVFDKKYDFTRTPPEVTWRYKSGSSYVEYDEDDSNSLIRIEEVDTNYYLIKTSVLLECSYMTKYNIRFIGNEPSHTTIHEGLYYMLLSINESKEWKLEIYYPDDESTKITYVCILDTFAPLINVSYDSISYLPNNTTDLDELAKQETKEGVVLNVVPSNFEAEKLTPVFVRNNDTVYASNLTLDVDDDNELREVIITLNGVEIKKWRRMDSVIGETISYTLTEIGEYEITAMDVFGNKSVLKFTKSNDNSITRTIDSEEVTENTLYYCGESDIVTFASTGKIVYKIENNGNVYKYAFIITDTGVYNYVYKTIFDGTEMRWTEALGEEIYVLGSNLYYLDEWYPTGCNQIMVKATEKGYSFKLVATPNETSATYTYYPDKLPAKVNFTAKLYSEANDLVLINKTDLDTIVTNRDNNLILVHDEFIIDYSNISSYISKVSIGYSDTKVDYDDFELTDIDLDTHEELSTLEDGFYLVKTTNIYGKTIIYLISKFVNINVEVKVEYTSKDKNIYSTEYEDVIYSNKSATITLYDNNMYTKFQVEKKNNNTYELCDTFEVKEGINIYYVYINEVGSYKVTVIDNYGNTVIRFIDIKDSTLTYNSSFITGFNDGAIDFYSNSILSINKAALDSDGIVYVKVDDTVVLDIISQNNKINDESLLENCIGEADVRKTYSVTFRDKYGNECSVDIHYSAYTTLIVSRNFKTDSSFVNVDIKEDVYSNNSIRISTDSKITKNILVDGELKSLGLEFSFDKDGNYANRTIEYSDEYGFSHTFTVHIIRQSISLNVITDSANKEINNILTVGGDFSLSYTKDCECKYSINDAGENVYNGEVIKSPGVYFFTVTDEAGNQSSLRVKLDNICEYEFTEGGSKLFNLQVVDGNVVFYNINDDTVEISSITKDGKKYEITRDTFSEHGFYHVELEDEIGNKSEFEFYIITKKQKEFKYTAPEEYIISEMYIEVTEGYKDKFTDFETTKFDITADGKYTAVLMNKSSGVKYTFEFIIDNSKPNVTLNGVENNGSTKSDVVLSGLESGCIVEIYRSGKLVEIYEVTGSDSITITEAGVYNIVITNEAGVTTELAFKKDFIMNTAGSVLVITSIVTLSMILLVGLMLRKRSKVDR